MYFEYKRNNMNLKGELSKSVYCLAVLEINLQLFCFD